MDTASHAVKQPILELRFQQRDLTADPGLSGIQANGGLAEACFFIGSHKSFK
jgi:hypothetical protein